jgi:hypothetical protein
VITPVTRPSLVSHHVGHSNPFFNSSSGGTCAIEEDRIQNRSSHGEADITVAAIAMIAREVTVYRRSVRRVHSHARELRGAGVFDLL